MVTGLTVMTILQCTQMSNQCCTLETNIIVYVNFTLINLKKEETMILLLHVNKEVLCTFLGGTL